ncbi:MAG: major capsid protein [Microviridae sp.]|nr:MAG: major capsid protein [Microviridae sp.]
MANPFKPSNSAVHKPNRNSFDLSHSNHLTFGFGQLIPCLCQECLPGDTFKIDSALGLRFMPLAFPVQTKVRAHVHFFYQRAKNLWPDFLDFIYGNDKLQGRTLVHPYIDFGPSGTKNLGLLETCGLGDYLGLPTVRYSSSISKTGGSFDYRAPVAANSVFAFDYNSSPGSAVQPVPSISNAANFTATAFSPLAPSTGSSPVQDVTYPNRSKYGLAMFYGNLTLSQLVYPGQARFTVDFPAGWQFDDSSVGFAVYARSSTGNKPLKIGSASVESVSRVGTSGTEFFTRVVFSFEFLSISDELIGIANGTSTAQPFYVGVWSRFQTVGTTPQLSVEFLPSASSSSDAVADVNGSPLTRPSDYHISALPFRCYESIYNAFYRDNRNNPFKTLVDGTVMPVYNKYVTTTDGGADSTNYGIFNRNWELDQFTSAVQSPQQGVAPLVGISSLGKITVNYEGQDYSFDTETADDADTITKVNVTENVPDAVARSLVNIATSGISINDFRNVNAYQRWLETNIRRGLKYKDQTLARWGVEPSDSSLDMPEFIGGYSVDVDINTVTNTNGDGSTPLGDYAAQATAFGGSKHKISHYCDQHGFIMAIVSVVPVPVYTQLLPKMFLRESALDYYSPEFGQIGMQAVPYRELCPLELFGSDGYVTKPTDVFGYQRPWYEYIYANDSAHGLFRTDFNQFLLSRTFGAPPTLGPDFLTIKESSLNDVFTVKNRNSILGMVRFNIEAKRPIPSVSVPSL